MVQEHNAESALLKDLTPSVARVYRDGKLHTEFLARDIVPGDIVDIQVGDMNQLISVCLGSKQLPWELNRCH